MEEFFENFIQDLFKELYSGLYENCEGIFNNIFDTLNSRVEWAGENIGRSLEEWNPSSFSLVNSLAENAFMPIAGFIITFVFCYELIHMCQEGNRMQNIKLENIIMVLFKFVICLIACVRSIDIVMGCYSLGSWVSAKISGQTEGTFGSGITLDDVVPSSPSYYDFGLIIELLGVLIVLCLSLFICNICAVIIYVKVNMWFIEMLVYSVPASIPMATFFSKEWGQMGMNYVRKIFAVGFEGAFMLLMLVLYGGIISNISSTDFLELMTMMCGSGVGLIFLLFKAGNISASIFNAH